jgi:hypothetical protein
VLTHGDTGREWIEIGREPYRRRDGSTTELIVWACSCAIEGCDGVVEIRTPVENYERSKAFGAKHCPLHKLSRVEAAQRWSEAVNKAKVLRETK